MCVIDEPNAYIVFCFLTGRRTAVSTVEDVVKAVKGGGPHFFVDVLRLMDAADGDEEGDGDYARPPETNDQDDQVDIPEIPEAMDVLPRLEKSWRELDVDRRGLFAALAGASNSKPSGRASESAVKQTYVILEMFKDKNRKAVDVAQNNRGCLAAVP